MNQIPSAQVFSGQGLLRRQRESAGLSLQALADQLQVSPQAVHQFEKSEVAGTISLGQLDRVARAMGLRLAYALEKSRNAHSAPAQDFSATQPRRKVAARKPASSSPTQVPPTVSFDRFSITSD